MTNVNSDNEYINISAMVLALIVYQPPEETYVSYSGLGETNPLIFRRNYASDVLGKM